MSLKINSLQKSYMQLHIEVVYEIGAFFRGVGQKNNQNYTLVIFCFTFFLKVLNFFFRQKGMGIFILKPRTILARTNIPRQLNKNNIECDISVYKFNF